MYNIYILINFLLITLLVLIIVSNYCYHLLPDHNTSNKFKGNDINNVL